MIKNARYPYCKAIFIFIAVTLFIPNANTLAEEPEAAQEDLKPESGYKAQNLRDPFEPVIKEAVQVSSLTTGAPAKKQEEQPPSLSVQGLIWGGRFSQAIINNKVLKVGDTIEEARVISINKDGVIIFFAGNQYKLSAPARQGASGPATGG